MAFWKVPVKRTQHSFVIIESEIEPNEYDISSACIETLGESDWALDESEYESDEDPFEVTESYACEFEIYHS